MSLTILVRHTVATLALLYVVFQIGLDVVRIRDGNLTYIGFFAGYTLAAVLFLKRKPSQDSLTKWGHWATALLGTFLNILFCPVPNGSPWLFALGSTLIAAGGTIALLALASLGTSFGVFAARREIKTGGLYRFVRHPLYCGEEMLLTGLVLQNLNLWNAGVLLLQFACQLIRIQDEEALLLKDQAYADFVKQTPYRLVPGLF